MNNLVVKKNVLQKIKQKKWIRKRKVFKILGNSIKFGWLMWKIHYVFIIDQIKVTNNQITHNLVQLQIKYARTITIDQQATLL